MGDADLVGDVPGVNSDLLVSEVFGPTVQGEGPSMGRRCAFIRLGLCNLDCRWCDTPYTWDWSRFDRKAELERRTVVELVDQVAALGVGLVVVSGGEPLVQRRHLTSLVVLLHARGMEVEVETNGTLLPSSALLGAVTRWNVSPKLAHSGVDRAKAIHPEVLSVLAGHGAALKFVVQSVEDLDEVAGIVAEAGVDPVQVWVMPEGTSAATVTITAAEVADAAIARGYNMTTRLHVLTWGNRRGV